MAHQSTPHNAGLAANTERGSRRHRLHYEPAALKQCTNLRCQGTPSAEFTIGDGPSVRLAACQLPPTELPLALDGTADDRNGAWAAALISGWEGPQWYGQPTFARTGPAAGLRRKQTCGRRREDVDRGSATTPSGFWFRTTEGQGRGSRADFDTSAIARRDMVIELT